MKILVSACLLGANCKYNGGNNLCSEILHLQDRHTLLPVCPEQLGGLSTPRSPAERKGDRVITCEGADVTQAYQKGAQEALALAKRLGAQCAILKARSPACGCGAIYDGSFTHHMVSGRGVAAQLMEEAGIPVYTEEMLPKEWQSKEDS